jgi:hypothetical protein
VAIDKRGKEGKKMQVCVGISRSQTRGTKRYCFQADIRAKNQESNAVLSPSSATQKTKKNKFNIISNRRGSVIPLCWGSSCSCSQPRSPTPGHDAQANNNHCVLITKQKKLASGAAQPFAVIQFGSIQNPGPKKYTLTPFHLW